MTFIFGAVVLLAIALVAWLAGSFIKRNPSTTMDDETARRSADRFASIVRAAGVGGSLALLVVLGACSSVHTVDNGHIGIVREFGPVVGTTGDGIATILPWQSLHEVSIQNEVRRYNMTNTGENAIGSAVSSDTQEIFVNLIVDYSLVRAKAVDLYKLTGGAYIERKLDPAVPQIVKGITAEYKAIEIARNREKIRREIQERLNAELEPQGIRINVVSLPNFSPTKTLLQAIEETVQAEQNSARERAKVEITKAQADQAIETARGVAQSNLVKAQAEAQAIRAQGAALRQNPEVIRLRAIEKLNPQVQMIVPENSNLILPGIFEPRPNP